MEGSKYYVTHLSGHTWREIRREIWRVDEGSTIQR